MTEAEQRIYDAMSERERAAIDALSEELRPGAILIWSRTQRPKREMPAGYVPWDKRPRRETVAPNGDSFQDVDEPRERYP